MARFQFLGTLLILLVAGCATVTNPITDQPESILISEQQEIQIGRSVAQEIARQMKLVRHSDWVAYVEDVGYQVADVSDRPNLPYQFRVVADKELNAFSTPGGWVYINMGLVRIANEDELAAVLAHEVGHIAARHSVKHMQTQMGYQWLISLAGAFGGVDQNAQKIAGAAFDLIQRGFSREDELEADILAIRYTYWVGYNPKALITILKKMQEEEKREPSAIERFISTHPALSERIARAEEELEIFLEEERQFRKSQ